VPSQSYSVTASVEPGARLDDRAMSLGELVGFLRGMADNLDARRSDPPTVRLSVAPREVE
jgi:hypothetical protein